MIFFYLINDKIKTKMTFLENKEKNYKFMNIPRICLEYQISIEEIDKIYEKSTDAYNFSCAIECFIHVNEKEKERLIISDEKNKFYEEEKIYEQALKEKMSLIQLNTAFDRMKEKCKEINRTEFYQILQVI